MPYRDDSNDAHAEEVAVLRDNASTLSGTQLYDLIVFRRRRLVHWREWAMLLGTAFPPLAKSDCVLLQFPRWISARWKLPSITDAINLQCALAIGSRRCEVRSLACWGRVLFRSYIAYTHASSTDSATNPMILEPHQLPVAVRGALLTILAQLLLEIRLQAAGQNAEQCVRCTRLIRAIPSLLTDPRPAEAARDWWRLLDPEFTTFDAGKSGNGHWDLVRRYCTAAYSDENQLVVDDPTAGSEDDEWPPSCHEAVLRILGALIEAIHTAAALGESERCFRIADDLHNFPALLRRPFDAQRLREDAAWLQASLVQHGDGEVAATLSREFRTLSGA